MLYYTNMEFLIIFVLICTLIFIISLKKVICTKHEWKYLKIYLNQTKNNGKIKLNVKEIRQCKLCKKKELVKYAQNKEKNDS